jgi:hypothetical protein
MRNHSSRSRRLSVKKVDGIAVNVIVSIGVMEIDIWEKILAEDEDFDVLLLENVQHRQILQLNMKDLIINFGMERDGRQNINLILT